jgi:beta-glucosidase/6-phospho-beta-glucosidase/beta-galactosidase
VEPTTSAVALPKAKCGTRTFRVVEATMKTENASPRGANVSRRDFGKTAALALLGTAAGCSRSEPERTQPLQRTSGESGSAREFPRGYYWGVATAKEAGNDAPKFTDEEMKIIGSPLDFVGINVYIPTQLVMASDEPAGYRVVPFNVSHPKMFSSWHRLAPESQYWSPRLLHSLWKPKEIYITENGCAASDVIAEDGKVYDSDRLMYLRNGMMYQQLATSQGIPLKGSFYWSAMDNLEWIDGFGTRFGLVYVDFKTQKRTPKLSASWFREAAKRNAVV